MRFRFLVLFCFLFLTSCSWFSYNFPDYNYDFYNPNKRINENKTYLLNTTSFFTSKGINQQYEETISNYFKKKLNQNLKLKNQLKDNQNKYVLPFDIPYDIKEGDIDLLLERTNLDFIILSKIEYLEFLDKQNLSQNNKSRLFSALSGSIASIKIIDLKNREVVLEMSCTASISDTKSHFSDEEVHQLTDLNRIPIHNNSFSLSEKAMKKLLRKIK